MNSIDRDMDFLLSGSLKKSLATDEAISHLLKAKALLTNADFVKEAQEIDSIIQKATSIDEIDIEVQI